MTDQLAPLGKGSMPASDRPHVQVIQGQGFHRWKVTAICLAGVVLPEVADNCPVCSLFKVFPSLSVVDGHGRIGFGLVGIQEECPRLVRPAVPPRRPNGFVAHGVPVVGHQACR